jgi:hypothetical protein
LPRYTPTTARRGLSSDGARRRPGSAEREAVLVGERDDELIREGARHEIRDALALLDAVAEQEAVAEESDVDVGEREVAVFPKARSVGVHANAELRSAPHLLVVRLDVEHATVVRALICLEDAELVAALLRFPELEQQVRSREGQRQGRGCDRGTEDPAGDSGNEFSVAP